MPEPFTVLRGTAVPLLRNDIDTDTIAPGSVSVQRKKSVGSEFSERGSSTLADDLFGNWRYDAEGKPRPDFPFNQPRYQGARILLTGANFGCGSSRESAVWMLSAWGIRCIIASSFAEIFSANCFANGILPLLLPEETMQQLSSEAESGSSDGEFVVDLNTCELTTPSGHLIRFTISDFQRRRLLLGLDEIAITLESIDEIEAFLQRGRELRPWLYAP